MRYHSALILITSGLAVLLSGCGSGTSLSTGSLTGGSSQPAAQKPVTASDRALHVAATVARAQRCGFVFEPEQMRASFFAAEQQAGATPDVMQRVQKEFDFTRQSILTAIVKDEGYCTEGRNREVKAALTRHLAGDYNPPRARQEINVGAFDHQRRTEQFDGNKVFEPPQRRSGGLAGD